jgi:hypothetical protein
MEERDGGRTKQEGFHFERNAPDEPGPGSNSI